MQPVARELFSRDPADSPELGNRQCGHEAGDILRADYELAVGFVPVAGDLGEQLIGRNAGARGNADFGFNTRADFLGHQRGAAPAVDQARYIEIGFIERKRLDAIGVIAKDGVHAARGVAVALEGVRQQHQIRALAQRPFGRHRRMDAKAARDIIAGRNHPALLGQAADRKWNSAQGRVVAHFDRGIKTVAIDMDDLAGGHGSASF